MGAESDHVGRHTYAFSLSVASLRFVATAEEAMTLPAYLGSALRGAFGHTLKEVGCFYRERGAPCEGCVENREAVAAGRPTRCVYGYLFETPHPPGPTSRGGQREVAHPYVIRPVGDGAGGTSGRDGRGKDEARLTPAGTRVAFEVQLFGRGIDHVGLVVEAGVRMARRGLGVGRWTAEVRELWEHQPFGTERRALPFLLDRSALTLVAGWDEAVARARTLASGAAALHYLTPTRLVRDGYDIHVPTFPVLARALLRRLTALAQAHGGEAPAAHFSRLARQAEGVRLVSWDGEWRDWDRYSARQERRITHGGLVGVAVYEGELEPFLPYLVYGQAVHVGKLCTFGAGRYRVVGGGLPDE